MPSLHSSAADITAAALDDETGEGLDLIIVPGAILPLFRHHSQLTVTANQD